MTVAVIQMVSGENIAKNLADARILLEQAAENGARLAVLPENFAALGKINVAQIAALEAQQHGPILSWLAQTARELGLWIVGGTVPLLPLGQAEAKPCASSLLFNALGECVARYDKLHLFDAAVGDQQGSYKESERYSRGQHCIVVDTPVGRLGMTICYDLRFPALYAALREAGAELISVPSAFTALTGAAHWQVLLRARAIETQCLLLASNQGGMHALGRETFGHSAIIDAWGTVLAELPTGAGCVTHAYPRAEQAAIRQRMPIWQHKRFSVAQLSRADTEDR
ncbi:MAG: carbon-nitrogen hydrolase family protein [Pseudomonas sp.]|jgi:predicted amidohydrolase|nr:carbon-nitrogen hydrolase family protein [Pseudomonas sp.]